MAGRSFKTKPTEIDVEYLTKLAQGRTIKELAYERRITKPAVQKRLVILRKLFNAHTTTHLIVLAIQQGYVKLA